VNRNDTKLSAIMGKVSKNYFTSASVKNWCMSPHGMWCYFWKNINLLITVHERHRQTALPWQYSSMHYSASRVKNKKVTW